MKRVHRHLAHLSVGSLVLAAMACASAPPAGTWSPELAPSSLATSSTAEAEVLARAAQLPVEQPVTVAGLHVLAAAPYSAASGRLCRQLQIDQQPRLACDSADGWVFVPVLLESP